MEINGNAAVLPGKLPALHCTFFVLALIRTCAWALPSAPEAHTASINLHKRAFYKKTL